MSRDIKYPCLQAVHSLSFSHIEQFYEQFMHS